MFDLNIQDTHNKDDVFPLPRNFQLSANKVVEVLADYGRQMSNAINNKSDFPQKVKVVTKEGKKYCTELSNVFSDGGSQGDGTFYFSDDVRSSTHGGKLNYLFGREIEYIVFIK